MLGLRGGLGLEGSSVWRFGVGIPERREWDVEVYRKGM